MVQCGARSVFKSRPDTALMHLAHPMLQKTLSSLTRLRFPGSTEETASCWTVGRTQLPAGVEAVIQLTVEELAVNDLRETFHHWVRTVRLPVRTGALGEPMDHATALSLRRTDKPPTERDLEAAREIWADVADDVKAFLKSHGKELDKRVGKQLEQDHKAARDFENQRYASRQAELSVLIQNTTMERLKREIDELRLQRQQGLLFDAVRHFDELERDIQTREEELVRRKHHYEDVRRQLAEERERIIKDLIPKRYAMRGEVQVFPVAVEILFGEKKL